MTDAANPEDVKLTFGEHLEELRARVIYSLLAVLVCFVICYSFKTTLLDIVRRPHDLTMKALGLEPRLNVIRYQEGFLTLLKISFIAALVMASPVILYQAWKFVWIGLLPKERRYVAVYAPVSLLSFLAGVVFGYFFLIPVGLRFLLSVLGPDVRPQITMAGYVSLVTMLTLVLGLVFELPLVMLFLSKIGVLTAEQFAEHRRPAILLAFVLGAVFTPPDPFTQVMMALPMIALYEVGILAAGFSRANLLRFLRGAALAAATLAAAVLWTRWRTAAVVLDVRGDARVAGRPARPGQRVRGWICAGRDGRVQFRMPDRSTVKMDRGARVRILRRSELRLRTGTILVRLPSPKSQFLVRTPAGDVTARGGAFQVQANDVETVLTVLAGRAELVFEGVRKPVLPGRADRLSRGGVETDVKRATAWARGWGAPENDPP